MKIPNKGPEAPPPGPAPSATFPETAKGFLRRILEKSKTKGWGYVTAAFFEVIILGFINRVVEKFFSGRIDPKNWFILKFIEDAALEIPDNARVLDAGAGSSPFRTLFRRQRYNNCDFFPAPKINFVGDLHQLPVADASYDAVLCTEVLEHVQYPQLVLDEFFRVLKPGGCLYVTVPQGWQMHYEPHNYFYFTRYGLELLVRNAGFETASLQELGGIFCFLGKRIRGLVLYFYYQNAGILKAALLVLHLLLMPLLGIALPLLLFFLDPLDRQKKHTLGYSSKCRKPLAPCSPPYAELQGTLDPSGTGSRQQGSREQQARQRRVPLLE